MLRLLHGFGSGMPRRAVRRVPHSPIESEFLNIQLSYFIASRSAEWNSPGPLSVVNGQALGIQRASRSQWQRLRRVRDLERAERFRDLGAGTIASLPPDDQRCRHHSWITGWVKIMSEV